MKATGIVRRIDDLGRVVIPKEIRRTLRIREGDPLEIFTDREGRGNPEKIFSYGGTWFIGRGVCGQSVLYYESVGMCDRYGSDHSGFRKWRERNPEPVYQQRIRRDHTK